MARFACPTGSTYSSFSSDSTRSSTSQTGTQGTSQTTPARRRYGASASPQQARRKAKENHHPWPTVYVGNLLPGVTAQELSDHFLKECGQASRIDIRCSYGDPTAQLEDAPTSEVFELPGRRYASIQWTNLTSYQRALKLDGTIFQEAPILVTLNAGDLPEVKDLVLARIQEKKLASKPLPKRLQGQATLLL